MKSLNELIWNNEDLNDDAENTLNDVEQVMVALCGSGGTGGGIGPGCGFLFGF